MTPSESASNSSDDKYVSPYADFFDNIKKGKTTSGLTDDNDVFKNGIVLDCGVRECDIRFKTTSYGKLIVAPYVNTEEHKVTLRLKIDLIPFTNNTERSTFRQLVEGKIDTQRDEVNLVSTQFASRIENKRHVVHMLDRLVFSARDLAKDIEEERKKALDP
eukprot:CAMPEP_0171325186 /NCGR_PEP_ID=MMETSP0816-20121228/116647_1 /TAXON_ID=420281 /ORGANISM="Proboscia inermis, Strain CCAP1064/1" /LENGTH=160 /DNA_ID=CAMNT_0011824291 /DNA_START=147 /DNA_END=629 /DNA_ORIENTATION=+